jgi:hypothetical protein
MYIYDGERENVKNLAKILKIFLNNKLDTKIVSFRGD